MKHWIAFVCASVIAASGPAASGQQAAQRARGTAAPFDVVEKTIEELQAAMSAGRVTSRQLVEAYLARIEAYDHRGPDISAFITLNPRALETADSLDRERGARGPRGPLHGIPIVLKDNFDTADMPTTAGSIALASHIPPDDAFQVKKLREAGAVILGKTNLHELASGYTSISSLGAQTRNPYDPRRNPGGSSGGTGAAVAASFAVFGMGSDTCGSIRVPASHNSLVGLRGTEGLSSRDGIIPLSHTQDIGGPLARTVADLAIALDATSGPDPADSTTDAGKGHIPESYRELLKADALKGARIGVLTELFGDAAEDAEVGGIVRKAIDRMKTLGAEPMDVKIPEMAALVRTSGVINAEFKFDLEDYLRQSPKPPVRSLGEILARGLYVASLDGSFRRRNAVATRDSDEYRKALEARAALRKAVTAALSAGRLAAIAYPTIRRKAALIGEGQGGVNCSLSAQSGLPAISVQAGFTDDGLPVGIELLGAGFSEAELLSLAYSFEQATHVRVPPPFTPVLQNGRAPASITFVADATSTRMKFSYDPVEGRLRYELAPEATGRGRPLGRPEDEILYATIHRGVTGETGPAVFTLRTAGTSAAASALQLSRRDQSDLMQGHLYLLVGTRTNPAGTRAQLKLP